MESYLSVAGSDTDIPTPSEPTGDIVPASEPRDDIVSALTTFLAREKFRAELVTKQVGLFTPRVPFSSTNPAFPFTPRDVLGTTSPDKALVWYARNGYLIGVIRALELGANIHFCTDVALRMAATKGHLPVVRYLLDERVGEKANIHAEVDDALMIAAWCGHLPVVRYLLDERNGDKANIHAGDDGALRWAAELGHLPVVRYLISKGANVEVLTPEQRERYGV